MNFVVKAPRPNFIEPLFTRDPAQISEVQVLMAMMAIGKHRASNPHPALIPAIEERPSTPVRSARGCASMWPPIRRACAGRLTALRARLRTLR
ncbi:hypothetical protein J2W96_007654 [Variovorax guangxiensis]|nr:hypothetical protein [Variovorax guangxiensis]